MNNCFIEMNVLYPKRTNIIEEWNLSITPNLLRHKGEKIKGRGPIQKFSGFSIYSGLEKEQDSSKHIDSFSQKIRENLIDFMKLKKNTDVIIQCSVVLYSSDTNFGFYLDKKFVSLLNDINASLDVDIYSIKN